LIISVCRYRAEGEEMTNEPDKAELSEEPHAAYGAIEQLLAQSTRTVALPPKTPERLSSPAAKLLRSSRLRLFGVPVMVFGIAALLAAYGISGIEPVEQPKLRPQPQTKAADDPATQKQRESRSVEVTSLEHPSPEQPVEPAEPFRSLVLDAAQSYLASGRLPVVTSGPLAKPRPATR
jgi:hypothetical protein